MSDRIAGYKSLLASIGFDGYKSLVAAIGIAGYKSLLAGGSDGFMLSAMGIAGYVYMYGPKRTSGMIFLTKLSTRGLELYVTMIRSADLSMLRIAAPPKLRLHPHLLTIYKIGLLIIAIHSLTVRCPSSIPHQRHTPGRCEEKWAFVTTLERNATCILACFARFCASFSRLVNSAPWLRHFSAAVFMVVIWQWIS